MPPTVDPEPLLLDLADFDAVGITTEVVIALRSHAIQSSVDVAATISAPDDWHQVVITARPGGHVVIGVRFTPLSTSRWHNVARALELRGWQQDEDGEGATRRHPPGTQPTDAAFEVLAAVTASGSPADVRTMTAVDGHGVPVDLA